MKKILLTLLLPSLCFGAVGQQIITPSPPLSLNSGLLSIPQATTSVSGYLTNTDWNTFNNKLSGSVGNITSPTTGVSVTGGTGAVIGSGVSISVQTASGSQPGLLSSSDWTTFNSKANGFSAGNLSGNAPLSVTGGNGVLVGSSASLSCATANTTTTGCLSSTDWNTFNNKAPVNNPNFTGTIGTPLTASRALVTDGSGNLSAASTTSTEVGYVSGVTSAIQTQLNAKSPTASPTFTGTVTIPATVYGNCHIDPVPQAVTCSGTQNIDLSTGNNFIVTLTAACTITQSNPQTGCAYYFKFLEGGSGGYSLAVPASWHWPSNTIPSWDTTLAHWNTAACVWDGTNSNQSCSGLTGFQ